MNFTLVPKLQLRNADGFPSWSLGTRNAPQEATP
jgi:hypothetical protein